jgi:hypothetical protein
MPALNATVEGAVVFVLPLLLPLLLQALIKSAATAPTAVVAMMLRLFMP